MFYSLLACRNSMRRVMPLGKCREGHTRLVDFGTRTYVCGVLNVTPDRYRLDDVTLSSLFRTTGEVTISLTCLSFSVSVMVANLRQWHGLCNTLSRWWREARILSTSEESQHGQDLLKFPLKRKWSVWFPLLCKQRETSYHTSVIRSANFSNWYPPILAIIHVCFFAIIEH